MLLIDHREAETLEANVGLQQLVGADDDVDPSARKLRHHLVALLAAAKARQLLDAHWPVGKSVGEGLIVLVGEQGGGNQNRHLAVVEHRHEGGSHRHLGLAEAHVPAHQPIHRSRRRHVGHHRVDCRFLVGSFLERKAVLEGAQLIGGDVERVAGARGGGARRFRAARPRRRTPSLPPGAAPSATAGCRGDAAGRGRDRPRCSG